ncbi:anaerobic ribonucleoside-triphosphate reductase activating protein [Candidatus Dojkabacteria bacterium]|nr:anaerobic ribonucleoside-triphosphate reductase activating protein [Candidatus Dojkabacteria bacterium]
MKFYGLKKVTLIDYPGKIACTLFTHGCNFRCPFCHNPELVIQKPDNKNSISSNRVLNFLSKRKGKLDGVVLTGGEPLLGFADMIPFIREVKKLGFFVKIDTNGTSPSAVEQLIKKKLVDFFAVDYKCTPQNYEIMHASSNDFDSFMKTLSIIVDSGITHEIRTTVVRGLHDENEIKEMMPLIRGVEKYVIQNFVPSKTIDPDYANLKGFTHNELEVLLKIAKRTVKNTEIRNDFE